MKLTPQVRAHFERVTKTVDRSDPHACWEWTGSVTRNGYASFKVGGKHGVYVYAHRVALLMGGGRLGPGMYACHHCDNRRCLNPGHLFAGTHLDNIRDAWLKGRYKNNGRNNAAIGRSPLFFPPRALSDVDCESIRLFMSNGAKLGDMARQFGTTEATIYRRANVAGLSQYGRREAPCCKAGHELSPDNLYVEPNTGWRRCRICLREKQRRTYWRTKAAA